MPMGNGNHTEVKRKKQNLRKKPYKKYSPKQNNALQ